MSLIAKIRADQIEARKNKEAVKATLLTTLLGEALKVGKDKGVEETADADTVAVVKKFINGVNDTIDFLKSTTNQTAKEICAIEKSILESYMPRQMTQEQIKGAILSQWKSPLNKGQLMSWLKANFAGQYDGKVAVQAVDELLANS